MRKFSQDIESLYDDNFARIVRNIELDCEPPGFYTYPKFYQEMSLCTVRLFLLEHKRYFSTACPVVTFCSGSRSSPSGRFGSCASWEASSRSTRCIRIHMI